MKKLLVFLFIISYLPVFAQNKTPLVPPALPMDSAHLVAYKQVVNVPNTTGRELLERAKNWYALYYPGWRGLVHSFDTTNNRLTAKCQFYAVVTLKDSTKLRTFPVRDMLTVDCKDGKYRYMVNGINRADKPTYTPIETQLDPNDKDAESNFQSLKNMDYQLHLQIDSLKKGMLKPSVAQAKKDNW
jgi:hypothetical protein